LPSRIRRFLGYLGTDDLRIDGETVKQAGLDWLASAGEKEPKDEQ
jgi:hypothetical protein